jgi:hypothetical protein
MTDSEYLRTLKIACVAYYRDMGLWYLQFEIDKNMNSFFFPTVGDARWTTCISTNSFTNFHSR